MSEISSGLVAFCYMSDRYEVALFSEPPTDPLYDDMFPVVRLSDAEAIIAQKDAEILDQCRLNGMGAERELVLLGQIERQSAALKLAKDALESCDVGDCSTSYVVMPSFDAVAIDEALAAIDALGEWGLQGEPQFNDHPLAYTNTPPTGENALATYYQHEKFINLCRAAKEMRAVLGDELYNTEIKAVLQPFNRVGRSIGLTHVRGKDIEAATAALRQKTAEFIKANEAVDALVERAAVESWCKKNGYTLVKTEMLNRWLCYDRIGGTKMEVEIEEILASSLDKPKSPE